MPLVVDYFKCNRYKRAILLGGGIIMNTILGFDMNHPDPLPFGGC